MMSPPLHTRFLRSLRHAGCALLLACSAAPALGAEGSRFDGAWALDADRSEEFGGLLEEFNDHLVQHQKKKRVEGHGAFTGLGGELSANNGYMGKDDDKKKQLRRTERVKAKAWELAPQVRALLEAKAIRIEQGDKCAITYDDGLKRLVTTVSEDQASTLQARPSTRDEVGRSTSHMEAGALVVDTDTEAGDRLVESFALNDAANELTLTAKIRRSDVGKPIEFKRVYTRQP